MDLLEVISGKWVFSLFLSICLYPVHIKLSEYFLSLSVYEIHFLETTVAITKTAKQTDTLKAVYMVISVFSIFIISFLIYRGIFERFIFNPSTGKTNQNDIISKPPEFPYDSTKLQMIIGLVHNKLDTMPVKEPSYLIVPGVAMYQNFLITGTIGTGKTASVMYPFLKQSIFYESQNSEKKAGMLILDVKGNFYAQALKYADDCGRSSDVILIKLEGDYTYNPMHKPNMEPVDLASRSRQVMDLFSGGAKKDKFWDTKAAQMMTASIRLLRMTCDYVTLGDIHKLVTNTDFLHDRLNKLSEIVEEYPDLFSEFEIDSCVDYFTSEFVSKAENMIESIKGCVTEMTGFFASSEKIHNTFCPAVWDLNFTGFEQCINEGKIVVLAMNVAEYPEVSKTIAAYLKLDFQSEIQQRTSNTRSLNKTRPMFFISDEYQEFVTENDARFYGLARESKCCNIVSSQSYTSLLQTLGKREAFDTLQQNLINKIWLRTDDKLTIETAQFLTGKEEKERYSKNISESINDAKRSTIFGRFSADKASLSESINISTQRDFVFDERVFTQGLELFKAVCFTANESGMNEPTVAHLLPYFKTPISDISLGNFNSPKHCAVIDREKYLIKMS